MLKTRLLLLFLFAFVKYALAQSCSSRVYCKTVNVRYMSMHEAPGKYLNATAIKSAITRNVSSCQTLCLRHNGCYSINLNISKMQEYGCHLLSANIYTESKNLVEHEDFIHLFMESPCKSKPCKNDGICVPHYSNDSYSCNCKKNATFIASGNDCENVASGFKSADYYWAFDKIDSEHTWTAGVSYYFQAESGTNTDVTGYKFVGTSKPPIVSVPGRRGSVVYHQPASTAYVRTTIKTIPCLSTFSSCQNGVSYSVWVRIPERETKRQNNKFILYTHMSDSGHWGMHFIGYGDENKGYTFVLKPTSNKKWKLDGFGKFVKRTLWNHFMFTFAKDGPLCAYINGVKDQCKTTSSYGSFTADSRSFRFGLQFDGSQRSEMYIDEFAVWKSGLSENDVKDVYNQGKL